MQVEAIGTGRVEATSGAWPTTGASPAPPHMNGTLGGIAGSLGLTPDALRGRLRGGASLASVAAGQGVARSDLLATLEKAVQARRADQGLEAIDATTLDRIANRAIDRSRGGRSGGPPAQPATASSATLAPLGGGIDLLG